MNRSKRDILPVANREPEPLQRVPVIKPVPVARPRSFEESVAIRKPGKPRRERKGFNR